MDQILLTNQIKGFLNEPYLSDKMMIKSDFVHVDQNSLNLKFEWFYLME